MKNYPDRDVLLSAEEAGNLRLTDCNSGREI